jgi:hypothetical protein
MNLHHNAQAIGDDDVACLRDLRGDSYIIFEVFF